MDKQVNWAEMYKDDPEMLAAFQALTVGNYAEYQNRIYKRNQRIFGQKLEECRLKGDWEEFCNVATASYETMPIAFSHFEEIPDNLKYDFLIKCYENHGDELPIVRKYVRQMRKWGGAGISSLLRRTGHTCNIQSRSGKFV